MATSKVIDTCDGTKWVEVSGTDCGTGWEFDGSEIFGITENDKILNCDGYPMADGDRQTIAVRNTIINHN